MNRVNLMTLPGVVPAKAESPDWLAALRGHLTVIAGGNLLWETLHLPLYTLWQTGTTDAKVFAVLHCTGGDLLIALASLTLALVLVGDRRWPEVGFWRVGALTLLFGLGYTIFSEWLNIVIRASWAYSDWMPVVPILGMEVGLSPLLQWLVVPGLALAWARRSDTVSLAPAAERKNLT